MNFGARNKPAGRVVSVKKGGIMAQVAVKTDGPVELSSVMTADSLRELKLKKGDRVRLIVKAIHVLIVKE